jgi:hypothetical protein
VEKCKQYGIEELTYPDAASGKKLPYWPVDKRDPDFPGAIGKDNIQAGSQCITKAMWDAYKVRLEACPGDRPMYLDVPLPDPKSFPAAALSPYPAWDSKKVASKKAGTKKAATKKAATKKAIGGLFS